MRPPDDIDVAVTQYEQKVPDSYWAFLGRGDDCPPYGELVALGSGKPRPTPEQAEHLSSCLLCRTIIVVSACGRPVVGHRLLREDIWNGEYAATSSWPQFIETVRAQAQESQERRNQSRKPGKAMLPHPLREVERGLSKLASVSLDRLPDVELRLMLFEISRALAASFAPENVYGRAVQRLDDLEFDAAIDLLLDERRCLGVGEQRVVLERLMQSIVHVRDALRDGDVTGAFAPSARLILDTARVQHHKSSTRVQVLLAYTYLLRLAGWYSAYIRASRALAHSCDALARREGKKAWDLPAEFESSETLRRVRTYATMNELIGLFYFKLTTARQERYRVRDYRGLSSLPGRFEELLRFDPKANFINEELLVVRAHLVRACENRCKKGAEQEWGPRMEQASKELRALISGRFLDTETGEIDAKRVIKAAHAAGEGHAADRTLDVIEEVLREQPKPVEAIRAERAAIRVSQLAGGDQR